MSSRSAIFVAEPKKIKLNNYDSSECPHSITFFFLSCCSGEEFRKKRKAAKGRRKSFSALFSLRNVKHDPKDSHMSYVLWSAVGCRLCASPSSCYNYTCFPFTTFHGKRIVTSGKFLSAPLSDVPRRHMARFQLMFSNSFGTTRPSTKCILSRFARSLSSLLSGKKGFLRLAPLLMYTNCRLWKWYEKKKPQKRLPNSGRAFRSVNLQPLNVKAAEYFW